MLEPQIYRANESLAKSFLPSWRIARIHNLDHFERVGFPVRLNTIRELAQIIDTMQEHRFDAYMRELDGLNADEHDAVVRACRDVIEFQLTYLPHRPAVLPISTMISAYALYRKICGAKPDVRSVLEIGPGCGYLSFFLRHHAALEDYSQIEACESFYILQNLVNVHCFGPRFDERALPPEDTPATAFFTVERELEVSPTIALRAPPKCRHFPWWRLGDVAAEGPRYDVITANANLLEFAPSALEDYLALLDLVLKPDGLFIVQCTGTPAHGTPAELLLQLRARGLSLLVFTHANRPTVFPAAPGSTEGAPSALREVVTPVHNAIFVKSGHPLFARYNDLANYRVGYVAAEPIVQNALFARPADRRPYSIEDFVDATDRALHA